MFINILVGAGVTAIAIVLLLALLLICWMISSTNWYRKLDDALNANTKLNIFFDKLGIILFWVAIILSFTLISIVVGEGITGKY